MCYYYIYAAYAFVADCDSPCISYRIRFFLSTGPQKALGYKTLLKKHNTKSDNSDSDDNGASSDEEK
jgi:hypothetical protein